ncbi:nascent polypeptide-associated complex subunit alpha, muscle-specific form-like [Sphaerodactylus townsendi]|uniref:nascent polypeptide-associated complex subunit alpha, muscle-specific form-like n=1 Tax=Sphaerodactylus townsendi TaxID=933632 RepID=UPI002026824A|nr:nascent polypeptide-associated complex subunit alpha, muscle-specific form-like [Sphaerodactylus townsendi]
MGQRPEGEETPKSGKTSGFACSQELWSFRDLQHCKSGVPSRRGLCVWQPSAPAQGRRDQGRPLACRDRSRGSPRAAAQIPKKRGARRALPPPPLRPAPSPPARTRQRRSRTRRTRRPLGESCAPPPTLAGGLRMRSEEAAAPAAPGQAGSPHAGTAPPPPRALPRQKGRLEPEPTMDTPHLDLLVSPEGCPSPLELKSAPSKKMWVKLRALVTVSRRIIYLKVFQKQ